MPWGIYKESEEVDRKSNLLTVFNDKIWGLCLTYKHWVRLERPARDKYSNLLQSLFNSGRKKFYNLGPRSVRRSTLTSGNWSRPFW